MVIGATSFAFIQLFPDCPKEEGPIVIGEDLAGEVVAVSSGVTKFTVGDRV